MGCNRSTRGRNELNHLHLQGQMGSHMIGLTFILTGKEPQPEQLAASLGYSSLTGHGRMMERLNPKQQRPLRPALALLPLLSDCPCPAWKIREGFWWCLCQEWTEVSWYKHSVSAGPWLSGRGWRLKNRGLLSITGSSEYYKLRPDQRETSVSS